jgi:hypothetical protein
MADHKSFTVATKVQVYFCDPRCPWQRGSNENTNGLLRQYFPKGTDLSRFSQAYLNKIALRLNQRPRQTLGFETPADRLRAVLQRPVELTSKSEHSTAEVVCPLSATSGLMHCNMIVAKRKTASRRSLKNQVGCFDQVTAMAAERLFVSRYANKPKPTKLLAMAA